MPKPTPKYLAWAQKGSVCPRWPQRTPTAQMWNGSWPCTHMRTHEDMQTHAQTCMHTYADMCRRVHTGRHMKICAEMHADLHMHAHMHTCRLICTCISTHANMHTWTHTHRDIQTADAMHTTAPGPVPALQPLLELQRAIWGRKKRAHTASPACSYGSPLYAFPFLHPMGHEERLRGEKNPPHGWCLSFFSSKEGSSPCREHPTAPRVSTHHCSPSNTCSAE